MYSVIYYHDFVGFRVSTREKSVIPQFDFFGVDLTLYILLRSVISKSFNWYSQTSLNYNMFTLHKPANNSRSSDKCPVNFSF